jgi:hypothetical protein
MFFDRVTAGSQRTYTDEGYLIVPGRVARVGVQQYLARELDLTDRAPLAVVNVYRPADEVFAGDSLKSYAEKDVTDDHPTDLVDAQTFRRVSVGHVCDVAAREGEWVIANMIIKAKDAIEKIESGKAELSAGYTAEYVREPGTTADGQSYEFVQRNIRINHVALVDTARAGRHARLFDNVGDRPMKVTLDTAKGLHAEVADQSTATLIQSVIDGLRSDLVAAIKTRDEAEAEKEKAEAAKDEAEEKAEELEKKSSDAAIADKVKSVLGVWDSARALVADFDPKGETDAVKVKRAVLSALKPSRDWAAKSDAYIAAAFDMAEEEKKAEDEDEEEKKSTDSLGKDFAKLNSGKATSDGTNAYQEFLKGGTK